MERTETKQWEEPHSAETAASGRGVDLVGMLLRQKWLIVLAAVIGAGLGYLYFTQQNPVYESSGRLLVVKENAPDLQIREVDSSVSYDGRKDGMSTQIILIRSPLIVRRAVEAHELQELGSFSGSGDPTSAIIGSLKIARATTQTDERTDVLELSFKGPDPQDCATVVTALMDSYQEFLGEMHQNVSKETVQLITEAKGVLLTQLREKEATYREFRTQAPLLWETETEAVNIHQARLNQIEGSRSELRIERSKLRAKLQAIEAAVKRGGNREALMLTINVNPDNPRLKTTGKDTLTSQLIPLLLEEQMFLERHGPDHPVVTSQRKRIALTRELYRNLTDDDDGRGDQEIKPVDFLTVYVDSLREQLRATEEQGQELDILFAEESSAAKALTVFEVENEAFRKDINRMQQLFDGVVKRLEEVNLIKDYGGYKTQVISPASAGWQVEPSLSRIMTIACMLGMLAGFGLAYLVELADKSFRSPEEVSDQLGLPIIGHIPFMRTQTASENSVLSPTLCVFHRPKSSLSEAYRAVRTALYFGTRGEGHKVIQVTSPMQGDGKSTLTANLAISIAQSGKRVLLMDADFRRPRINRLFDLNQDVGACTVIEGKAELKDAIQATEVENLWCMPTGPKPPNPSELLTSPRFQELLDTLRGQYDFILVDTPPILAVTDPSAVAARVDGVLLTIRISKKSRAVAVRAIETLNTLGAGVLGVVVNGVREERGYGYGRYLYGRYRYGYGKKGYGHGYGQGYGYGYGYGYGEKESHGYYTDDDDTATKPEVEERLRA